MSPRIEPKNFEPKKDSDKKMEKHSKLVLKINRCKYFCSFPKNGLPNFVFGAQKVARWLFGFVCVEKETILKLKCLSRESNVKRMQIKAEKHCANSQGKSRMHKL